LFLAAFTIRFALSVLLYGFDLNEKIVGDGDDSGWAGGLMIKETWEAQGFSLYELPRALLGAFDGTNRGYKYLLAAYFSITGVPSRLSVAALNCLCGALTAVFAFRIARIHFSEWVAVRAGWWTGLFPGLIIWSAQTVKEPIVILLEALALYGCLRLGADGFRIRYVVLSSAAVVVLASMRFYAAYVAGAVILLSLSVPQFNRRKLTRRKPTLASALAMGTIALPLLYYSGALANHVGEFEKWDLQQTERFRHDIAAGTGSGVETQHDMQTVQGLGLATFVGGAHLLLAPFPWNMTGGSLRLLLTIPEQLVWWCLFYSGVLPGLRHVLRHRLGDVLPMLLFVLSLGLIYSLTFGNIGVVYRQRAQLLPSLLIFAAVGRELRHRPLPGQAEDPRVGVGAQ
jgi:4-amino-4-deoxy-L-arabinose transferase-like glycosyltransferase